MREFRSMKIWQGARKLCKEVYKIEYPSIERFGIESQIRRAVVSISSNIAEGCGRRTNYTKPNPTTTHPPFKLK